MKKSVILYLTGILSVLGAVGLLFLIVNSDKTPNNPECAIIIYLILQGLFSMFMSLKTDKK